MIYIILDNSHEWDGSLYSHIVYVGTNKDNALQVFHKYFDVTPNQPNEKWCYEYELWEYPDNYNYYSTLDNGKLIIHIDNVDE